MDPRVLPDGSGADAFRPWITWRASSLRIQAQWGRRCTGALLAVLLFAISVLANDATARKWTSFAYPASFEHISVEHGLSQSTIHCMLQDRKGFLWLGTDSGLNRYDGFHFQVLHPEKNNPNSLSDDWILHLMQDRHGYLWVATRNGGITIVDPETMAMIPIQASEEPGGLKSRTVNSMVEDREGNIWIATEGSSLCMVSKNWKWPEKPTFASFLSSPQDPKGVPPGAINGLYCDRSGSLWIGSRWRGLGKLVSNPGNGKLVFDYYVHDPTHPDTSAPDIANAIQEDPFGLLWLGGDNGLFTLDPRSGSFQRWKTVAGKSLNLGNTRVLGILRDSTGTMWVASDGAGLLKALPRFSAQDPVQFQNFVFDAIDGRSLRGNGVQCVLEDRSGVLWCSSYQGGLNKLILNPGRTRDRETPSIFQYRNNPADPSSLSGDTISTMGEDRFGNLWIGTDGFGLTRVSPPTKPGQRMRFERFREDPRHGPGSLQSDVILTTHLDANKQLWFGTYNAGLVRVDQVSASAQPTFTHFQHDPKNPERPFGNLSSNFIRCIVDDGNGGFWLGHDGGGLGHFDPRTGRVKNYNWWGGGPKVLSSGALFLMVKDAFGTLWIATPAGLNRFNPQTEEFRVYKPGGTHSLSEVFINTLHLDETGTLWVGTKGGGLNRMTVPAWNGPEPQFTAYGTHEGLPGNVIKGILPDGRGNLWLSTSRALCRFNIQEGRAYPFTWQTELRRAEFIWNACFRSSSGELLFGSNDGLTLFHPEDITPNKIAPLLAITDFRVLHKSMPLSARLSGRSRSAEPEITLSPKDSNISFDFAALHFVAPERNLYATMLEGLDPTWKEADNNHSVAYTTLPPGNYVLRVKASNCDGVWNDQGLDLRIRVLPPWYKTWWFLILAILALAAGILGLIRFRLRLHIRAEAELKANIQEALAHIQALHGLLPVCAWCKKIRDDAGDWIQMEQYIAEHSQAEFSHGICPECKKEMVHGTDGPPPSKAPES